MWMWQHTTVIPALERLRGKNDRLKASLGYTDLTSKKKKIFFLNSSTREAKAEKST